MLSIILTLLSNLALGQSTAPYSTPIEDIRMSNINKSLRDLQNGKPTITGQPSYKNGICFSDSSHCQTEVGANIASTNTFSAHQSFPTIDVVSTAAFSSSIFMRCPAGFTEILMSSRTLGCMQTAEEGSASWYVADDTCFIKYGGRLPHYSEWYAAMNNFALTDETDDNEYTANFCTDTPQVVGAGALTAIGCGTMAGPYAYRCWIPK